MIKNLKERFPVFKKNPNLVFFDTAASALKVDSMINAITECYSYEYANIHRGIYDLSSKLTKRYEDSRVKWSVSKRIEAFIFELYTAHLFWIFPQIQISGTTSVSIY